MGIGHLVDQWMLFLHNAGPLTGIPLVISGGVLVVAGWRLWKYASVASYAFIGGIAGQMVSGFVDINMLWIAGGVLVGMVAGFVLKHFASTLLGGIVGGALAGWAAMGLGLSYHAVWLSAAISAVFWGAWAYVNRQNVVAAVTAFEGAALLVSGFAVMLSEWPWMYNFFFSMTRRSPGMIVFFLLVPTVVGVLLQHADETRSSMKSERSGR